jgi:glutaredoxin
VQITIYSTATCLYCQKLRDYLNSRNLPFTEKLIDSDDSAQKEMSDASSGYLGVPFTLIVKDDGTRETVIGFDLGRFSSILGIN